MANKRIQDLPSKGTTIAANDILELSEYQSPGVYISKKILGSELGGVTSFTALTDTPASYTGQTLKFVRVNAGETALEFATVSVSDTNIANTNLTLPTATRKLIWGGATSSDRLSFRNSTDTFDILRIQGDGGVYMQHPSTLYNSFQVSAAGEMEVRGNVHKISSADGTTRIDIGTGSANPYMRIYDADTLAEVTFQATTSVTIPNIGIIGNGKFAIGMSAFAGGSLPNDASTNTVYIKNGTAPTGALADFFQMYSSDITAGNAAPHFRTEAGDVIKLYKQASAGITTVGDLVTVLTNLGLLG